MSIAQLLRIALALAIIFSAGIFVGRYTAPRPSSLVSAGPRAVSTDEVMVRLTAELSLDPGQRDRISVIVEDVAEQLTTLPALSPQRREVFRKSIPQIRAALRPDQYAALDRLVETAERRAARALRRRDALRNGGPAREGSTNELPAPARPSL